MISVETPGGIVFIVDVTVPVVAVLVEVGVLIMTMGKAVVLPSMLRIPDEPSEMVNVPVVYAESPGLRVLFQSLYPIDHAKL
jgi:hypothetical protein